MTQLRYQGNNQKIIEAIAEANRILNNSEFHAQIEAIQSFSFTDYTGLQILNEFKNLNQDIIVEGYWWPLTKANANTVSTIRMNTAKLNRSKASIVNTLIHEAVHAVDWLTNNHWDYTHNGNSALGQENTAPWVIGDVAEDMVR